jgi:hypothetical protein
MKRLTAEDKAAIKHGVLKWRKNARVETPSKAKIHDDSCHLCWIYYDADCYGCPVQSKTSVEWCFGTPWSRSRDALNNWISSEKPEYKTEFHAAAIEMADFLNNLLPKKERL